MSVLFFVCIKRKEVGINERTSELIKQRYLSILKVV
nr:MAG TPA: hypothetical protein [Caudoviricetes sp.]